MTAGLIIDLFAGGGGASLGIEAALGRPVDYAINHDPTALAVHQANHPETIHLTTDIWKVKPRDVVRGRRVAVLWASPDCKHHSRAKGGKPSWWQQQIEELLADAIEQVKAGRWNEAEIRARKALSTENSYSKKETAAKFEKLLRQLKAKYTHDLHNEQLKVSLRRELTEKKEKVPHAPVLCRPLQREDPKQASDVRPALEQGVAAHSSEGVRDVSEQSVLGDQAPRGAAEPQPGDQGDARSEPAGVSGGMPTSERGGEVDELTAGPIGDVSVPGMSQREGRPRVPHGRAGEADSDRKARAGSASLRKALGETEGSCSPSSLARLGSVAPKHERTGAGDLAARQADEAAQSKPTTKQRDELRIAFWDAIAGRDPEQIKKAAQACAAAKMIDVLTECAKQLVRQEEPMFRDARRLALESMVGGAW